MGFRFLRSGILAAALCAFGAQSAAALSCMRPDLTQTMEEAKASEKMYHLIVGEFKLISKKELPRTDVPPNWHGPASDFPNPVRAEMRFDGVSLSPNARSDHRLTDFRLDVETSCAAHWCGGLPQEGQKMIAFVEARPGDTPILKIGACPQYLFWVQPGDDQVETLRKLF